MKTEEILNQIRNFNFPERTTGCGASLSTHFHMEIILPDEITGAEAWDIIDEIRKLNKSAGKRTIAHESDGEKSSITITWCGDDFPDDMICHCDERQDERKEETTCPH